MSEFALKRAAQAIIVILALTLVCYWILTMMPGDPVDMMIAANPEITSADIARLKELYGLNVPFYERYLNWLTDLLKGDLGYSRTYRVPVSELLGDRLLNTAILAILSLGLSLLIAVPLGVYAATNKNSLLDQCVSFFSFAGISLPSFWLALLLIMLFSVQLGLLPASGTFSVELAGQDTWSVLMDRARHLILPVISLSLMQIGVFIRYTRSAALEVLQNDYIRTARAKGLAPKKVLLKHALRNALIPIITVLALRFSAIFSGAIITETVFAYQGVGKLVFDAIQSNDFNVAMVSFLISITMVITMNFLADILYAVVDPRVKI